MTKTLSLCNLCARSSPDFAELLAMKLLRLFAADDVALVGTLVAEWDAFQGVRPVDSPSARSP